MRALRMRNVMANHQKLTTTSSKDHQSWSSYNYNRSCPRTQCGPLIVIQHLKQIGKVENLDNWLPHELTTNQSNCHFEKCCLLLFYATTMNHFLIGWWCATKSGFYATIDNQWWPAQLLNREETSKHFPKPNLYQKMVMVTVWWSAAALIHYSFLNPGETFTSEKHAQQINETQWKLQYLQPQKKGPNSFPQQHTTTHTTNTSKVEWIRLWSFASPAIFTWPLTNYHFFKHLDNFLQAKSTTSRMQKMLSKNSSNPETLIFML